MAGFLIALIVILGVVAANLVANRFPKFPAAFITIGVGLALSLFPFVREHAALESEFFMMFIIAPILFYDATRMNPYRLGKHLRSIIYLAGSLVITTALITTVVGVQVSLPHSIPLALLIAAIITPTDAVAANSITRNFEVPEGTKSALEFESLFNDATGLVLMGIAVTGVEANRISVSEGVLSLIKVAGGGLIVGLLVGYFMYLLVDFILSRVMDSLAAVVPVMMLTPFAAYALAEHFGTSGILAVVVAALFQVERSMRTRLGNVHEAMTANSLWSVASSVLNDAVFVLLGMNIFNVIALAKDAAQAEVSWAVLFAVIAYVVMLIARGFFAYKRSGESWEELLGPKKTAERRHNAVTFALTGVHGAVTLALAFAIPEGTPYRSGLIITAALVILLSLLVPTLVLPFWLPRKEADYTTEAIQEARWKLLAATKHELQKKEMPEELFLGIVQFLTSQVTPNRFSVEQANFNQKLKVAAQESRRFVGDFDEVDADLRLAYGNLIDLMLSQELSFAPLRSIKTSLTRFRMDHIVTKHRDAGISRRMTPDEQENLRTQNLEKLREKWRAISNANSNHMMDWVAERVAETTNAADKAAWNRVLNVYRFRHASMTRGLNRVELKKEHILKALNVEMELALARVYSGEISQAMGDVLIREIAEAQVWQSQVSMIDPRRAGRRVF
jgi:CPA1 family monovalent cation:H+ antiporter